MTHIAGRKFDNCSIPLVFVGHYFLFESGAFPRVSVVREFRGHPIFEIKGNEPVMNPLSDVFKEPVGIINVFDKQTGRFLYIIRPGIETNIVLGKPDGGAINLKVTDNRIHMSGDTIYNCVFNCAATTIFVDDQGRLSVEAAYMPPELPQSVSDNIKPTKHFI